MRHYRDSRQHQQTLGAFHQLWLPENEAISAYLSLAAIKAVNTTFQEAAALGVTVFVSAGDHGSDCGIGDKKAMSFIPAPISTSPPAAAPAFPMSPVQPSQSTSGTIMTTPGLPEGASATSSSRRTSPAHLAELGEHSRFANDGIKAEAFPISR